MSKIITVDLIEGGMELAEVIKNKYGQILLSDGVKLEQKHRKILKTWGIASVVIKDDGSDQKKVQYSQEKMDQAGNILLARFNWKPENGFEEEIYKIALERVVETELN